MCASEILVLIEGLSLNHLVLRVNGTLHLGKEAGFKKHTPVVLTPSSDCVVGIGTQILHEILKE